MKCKKILQFGILISIAILFSVIFHSSFPKEIRSIFAQEEPRDFEELKLYVGQVKTLPTLNPKRVAIARPEIADVQSVAAQEVVLEPKAFGATTLFIWDDYGQHSYKLKVFSEDLSLLKEHADSLIRELKLSAVETKINEPEGKLLLTGEVNELNDKERLLSALASLKDKILDLVTLKEERALVQSDVQILEISRDNLRNLGIEYQTSVSLTDDANKKMNKLGEMFATSMWTRSKLDLTLNLLVKEGKARVLSQPKLVCLSGKEAEFMVGGQVPVITSTLSSTGTTGNVTFKDYGITLKLKPTVKEDSNILLNLSTEVSEIDEINSVKTATTNAPAFTTRNAKSELYLKDGQSAIIAGLIKNKDSATVKKFPFLGDVPILGLLWRSRNFQANQTELVILLTPSIVQQPPRKLYAQEKQIKSSPDKLNSSNTDLAAYAQELRRRISSAIDYPSEAVELGLKGEVKIRLSILSSGQLKEALVIRSSGSGILDNAAINAIKKLAPFPSFPGSIESNEIAVDIPIIYR